MNARATEGRGKGRLGPGRVFRMGRQRWPARPTLVEAGPLQREAGPLQRGAGPLQREAGLLECATGLLARASILAVLTAGFVLPAVPTAAAAQNRPAAQDRAAAQDRPTVQPDDYGRFERLRSYAIDPTGRWVAESLSRVDRTVEVRVVRADGSGSPIILPHATSPEFSGDGRWLAYAKGSHPDSAEGNPSRLGLVDLQAGRDTVLFAARSFAFRDDGGWLAAVGAAPSDSVGADLIVFQPGGEGRTLLGHVDEYAWEDGGNRLAVTQRTAWGDANGVVLLDPDTGVLRTLASGDATFSEPTWRDDAPQLAVLRSVEDEAREGPGHDVLVWADVGAAVAPRRLDATGSRIPAGMRVAESGGISFEDDGRIVLVGLKPWDPAADATAADAEARDPDGPTPDTPGPDTADTTATTATTDDDPGPADVQIWHWNDDRLIRDQEYSAERYARRTLAAAWHLEADDLVVLGRDIDEPVDVAPGGRWGTVLETTPYRVERRFGAGTSDAFRVDVATGDRELLARGVASGVRVGPAGRRALIHANDRWTAVELATMERTDLEGLGAEASAARSLADYDYPGARPPWGVGAWGDDDGVAYLYDRHDVWRADLTTGRAERITDGAERGLEYRVVDPDPDASFADPVEVDDGRALWMSVRDLHTKASGYARWRDGTLETLLMRDAAVRGLTRAEDAERYALRIERWDDSPDVFTAGADLEGLRQVGALNPFQGDFAWGRTELLDYTTDAGHDLQAILVYPADFEPGRRYPLILYQYERLSDGVNTYHVPDERDYYDFQAWSQEGYFILMPDIVYEPGRPGPSALDAVEHALDAAVATGHVDPDHMGLIGHSWGGYQAAYLPTRTNRFAASVAGAAITNFMSFMGTVHWNGGAPELSHWETGQARMAAPFWDDLEGHLESSPANFIQDLETPVLLMHGDADGVVDFRQGLEYYNYARRLGKPVVMLVYPGADHGLSDEAQQVDYHRRILEWFGHWLKGEPAPAWITEGESWTERAERIGK